MSADDTTISVAEFLEFEFYFELAQFLRIQTRDLNRYKQLDKVPGQCGVGLVSPHLRLDGRVALELWPDAGTSCSTDQFRRVQRYSQSAPPRRSRAGPAARLLFYCQSACSRSLSHYPGPSAASHGAAQSLCSRPQSRALERWWSWGRALSRVEFEF